MTHERFPCYSTCSELRLLFTIFVGKSDSRRVVLTEETKKSPLPRCILAVQLELNLIVLNTLFYMYEVHDPNQSSATNYWNRIWAEKTIVNNRLYKSRCNTVIMCLVSAEVVMKLHSRISDWPDSRWMEIVLFVKSRTQETSCSSDEAYSGGHNKCCKRMHLIRNGILMDMRKPRTPLMLSPFLLAQVWATKTKSSEKRWNRMRKLSQCVRYYESEKFCRFQVLSIPGLEMTCSESIIEEYLKRRYWGKRAAL